MKLPKLYRVVYAKFEFVHDECVGGYHRQTCGEHHIKVRRVLCDDGWKWVPAESLSWMIDYDKRHFLDWLYDCSLPECDWLHSDLEWARKPKYTKNQVGYF